MNCIHIQYMYTVFKTFLDLQGSKCSQICTVFKTFLDIYTMFNTSLDIYSVQSLPRYILFRTYIKCSVPSQIYTLFRTFLDICSVQYLPKYIVFNTFLDIQCSKASQICSVQKVPKHIQCSVPSQLYTSTVFRTFLDICSVQYLPRYIVFITFLDIQ